MDNEETYLQSLISKRKIVRNYVGSKKNYPELKTIAKYAIKIPTAGFSRGIEIIHVSEKQNMNNISDNFEEQKNENIIKQNFASIIYSNFIRELSLINDN